MRTPGHDRTHACDRHAVARSTPHADDGLAYLLRPMELPAGARVPGRGTIPELKSNRWRHAGTHLPGVKRTRRA